MNDPDCKNLLEVIFQYNNVLSGGLAPEHEWSPCPSGQTGSHATLLPWSIAEDRQWPSYRHQIMACHSAQYHEHRSYQCIGLRGQVTPQNHYETLLQHQLAALTSRNHAVADAAIRAKCLQQALLKGFYKMHEEKCIFLFSLILKQGFSDKCRSQRRERTCFHTKFHGWFIKSILNVPKTPLKFLENRSNGCPFTLFWASLCMTGSIAKTPEERLSKEERFITILVFFYEC